MVRLNAALDAALSAFGSQPPNEEALQQRLLAEIPHLFDVEFKSAIRLFDKRLAEVLGAHEERSDRLLESIRKTAADLFDVPYQPIDHSLTFETTREPYWLSYHWEQSFGPLSPSLLDNVLPTALRRRRIERRFRNKVESLVLYNAGKLREKFYHQIDATFRRFRRSLDQRLTATVAATHGAAQAALKKRETHAGAAAGDMERFRVAVDSLQEIGTRLSSMQWPRREEKPASSESAEGTNITVR
jgi:hypothetical protein